MGRVFATVDTPSPGTRLSTTAAQRRGNLLLTTSSMHKPYFHYYCKLHKPNIFNKFLSRDDKVLAVSSLNFDPAVSKAAELMYQGRMPSGTQIK